VTLTVRPHLSALATVLLAVCALALLLAGPAAAAEPVALTATISSPYIVYPGSATISGAAPVPGAALSLLALPAGAADWTPAGSTTAGGDGAFSFTVAPSVSTEYRVAYEPAGQPAAQVDVSLRVRPRLATAFPDGLWLGGSVVLRGTVAPAHPGGTVTIDRRVDGVWQPFLTAALNADSRFALPWTPGAFGYFRLRARMDADVGHESATAASELVTVNRPNAHKVPMRYAHYIVIVRHEYRLYYYEHGALIRAFNVALGRPGYRTPLGYYRVYGKRKPAGGALGSCAMFYRRAGGIAIHGTNEPWLLSRPAPRDFSHGCARMYNSQALWLYARTPRGTHVHNLR